MEPEPLRQLISDLLSGDRRLQRKAVDEHVAENVRFSHIVGTVCGREAFYDIYRLAGTAWDYKVVWHEYLRAGDTVVLALDLGIKVPPFYLLRYHFPTIVLLRFATGTDGRPRLVEQVDHHSMLAILWVLGWPFTAISETIIRPLSGFVLSHLGRALDVAEVAVKGVLSALRGAVGGDARDMPPPPCPPTAVVEYGPGMVARDAK